MVISWKGNYRFFPLNFIFLIFTVNLFNIFIKMQKLKIKIETTKWIYWKGHLHRNNTGGLGNRNMVLKEWGQDRWRNWGSRNICLSRKFNFKKRKVRVVAEQDPKIKWGVKLYKTSSCLKVEEKKKLKIKSLGSMFPSGRIFPLIIYKAGRCRHKSSEVRMKEKSSG